jgi:hypothetical protein
LGGFGFGYLGLCFRDLGFSNRGLCFVGLGRGWSGGWFGWWRGRLLGGFGRRRSVDARNFGRRSGWLFGLGFGGGGRGFGFGFGFAFGGFGFFWLFGRLSRFGLLCTWRLGCSDGLRLRGVEGNLGFGDHCLGRFALRGSRGFRHWSRFRRDCASARGSSGSSVSGTGRRGTLGLGGLGGAGTFFLDSCVDLGSIDVGLLGFAFLGGWERIFR